jgi:hypothetical protein
MERMVKLTEDDMRLILSAIKEAAMKLSMKAEDRPKLAAHNETYHKVMRAYNRRKV